MSKQQRVSRNRYGAYLRTNCRSKPFTRASLLSLPKRETRRRRAHVHRDSLRSEIEFDWELDAEKKETRFEKTSSTAERSGVANSRERVGEKSHTRKIHEEAPRRRKINVARGTRLNKRSRVSAWGKKERDDRLLEI